MLNPNLNRHIQILAHRAERYKLSFVKRTMLRIHIQIVALVLSYEILQCTPFNIHGHPYRCYHFTIPDPLF